MRAKPVLLLAVALGCGTVAAFAATQVIKDQGKGAPVIETVDILVAAKDIAVNTKINDERFRMEKWPRDRLPQGAIRDIKKVEGKFTNQRLYEGEPLLERKINLSNASIAETLPPGCKVFDLPVDANNGGVGYIQPGHRVDIHGFFEKSGRIAESKSILVMENVEVLMVDGVAVRDQEEGASRKAGTIQLLIRKSQYEALNTAKNLGKLTLSLRPPVENEEEEAKTDNGEEFLAWVKNAVQDEGASKEPAETTTKPIVTFTPAPREKPKKKMMVILPSGTETYAWSSDDEIPQKVEEGEGANSSSNASSPSGVTASPYDPSNPQGLPSGMVWDGKQWTYNPSGFKPAYPTADDDNTKKHGYNEGAKNDSLDK